jgi:hypothetical protein
MIAAGLALATLLAGARPLAARPALSPEEAAGEAIYLRGVLRSGAPLDGTRPGGVGASGADAACVNCHQRSGLGGMEGRMSVPPVAGDYLYRPQAPPGAGEAAVPFVDNGREREPYTDATLARALREGLDSEGRPFGPLMPRYALGDADLAALVAYLKKLSVHHVPGVGEGVLHFATIVTPEADPVRRRGVLDVLEHFVAQKNRAPLKPTPAMRTSLRTQYAKDMYLANRRWQLHVWELTGPSSTWKRQLERRLAAEPVYAVISGIGGKTWAPVHQFCEEQAVPCLFPNVEVPVVAEGDFYPVYFSKGVLLEAQLVAHALLGADGAPAVGVVEQVYRAGDSGEAAADALAAALEGHGVTLHRSALPAGARGPAVAAALRKAAERRDARGVALVLWLRPPDVAALAEVPAGAATVYLSGLLGGLEGTPLPAAWRARAVMTYPFDLPDRRGVRLDYPLGFFRFHHIPIVAEQVQSDTYLACNLLADVLNRTADAFSRPYLVEQLQGLVDHRIVTGYYPRLSLASRQRFASKGGYLVRFRDPVGAALAVDGEWIVP